MRPITTFRGVVAPDDCDYPGNINVSRYFTACSGGIFAIQSKLGLSAGGKQGRKLSLVEAYTMMDFDAELSLGDAMCIETSISEIDTKLITINHELIRCHDELVAFSAVFKYMLFDSATRRATPFPHELCEQVSSWIDT